MSPAADPTATFLAALKATGLLTAEQFAELVGWAGRTAPDVAGLAKEVHRLGWLTPYQIKETFQGRGRALTVGRYVLLELLGEGGMGKVLRAHDARLRRDVALKLIRPERLSHPAAMARFDQEMKALGKLDHPNVVRAFDAGQAGDAHFVAMEFIDGADLTKVVKARGPLPVAEACEYARQAALGLQHAHEAGLVHRDVKPSNLIATRDGRAVKLVDLGLARLNDGAEAGRVTQEGFVLGTPDFLAPEQARDPAGVDTRADVYALGATLYYLLTARVPYDAPTPAEKLVRHLTDPPPDLSLLRPDAPPGVERVIHWCLAKKPADRPQTPAELAAALQPYCGGPAGAVYFPPPAASPTDDLAALTAVPEEPPIVAPRRRRGRAAEAGGFPVGWVAAGLGLAALAGVAAFAVLRSPGTTGDDPDRPVEGFTNSAGMKMVKVAGGAFRMGSPKGEPGRGADEGPAREVTVGGPFLVSATEVTHAQYARVTGAAPPGSGVVRKANAAADFPVEMVTYDDAVAFCRRLTDREADLPTGRAGWAYRLPTEAEWEYACRAGTDGPFWCGATLDNGREARYTPAGTVLEGGDRAGPVEGIPGKVGKFPANPWGLFDTHGNVAEWCSDWYGPYAADDPDGPAAGSRRVVRGGGFRDGGADLRSAARGSARPSDRRDDLGFRVVYAPVR